jgi:hypothetical protein
VRQYVSRQGDERCGEFKVEASVTLIELLLREPVTVPFGPASRGTLTDVGSGVEGRALAVDETRVEAWRFGLAMGGSNTGFAIAGRGASCRRAQLRRQLPSFAHPPVASGN